jgi:hypothetical protein
MWARIELTASIVNIDPLVEDAGISVQVADRSISQYRTKSHLTLLIVYRVNNCEDSCRACANRQMVTRGLATLRAINELSPVRGHSKVGHGVTRLNL